MIWENERLFTAVDRRVERTPGTGSRLGLKLGIKLLYNIIFLFAGFLLSAYADSSSAKPGFKYMRNYPAKDYNWAQQNWAILQDKRGIIYVGNQGGLLEFDGVSWRVIPTPSRIVRSMALDEKTGTIYIGGKSEFGFLAPDREGKGKLEYRLLSGSSQNKNLKSITVSGTHALKHGIFFRTLYHLYKWRNGKLDLIEKTTGQNRFKGSFSCNGELYIRKDKFGLMKLSGDRLKPIPGGDVFASESIFMITPYTCRQILIGTEKDGLYILDETNAANPVKTFTTSAHDYFKQKRLYYGVRLKSGDFAIATKFGGIVILTPKGKIKRTFTKANGLFENRVRYIFEDSQENLWIAQDKRIIKLEYSSPFSIYDERSNLPGIVIAVTIHGSSNRWYAGTTDGVFQMTQSGKFRQVAGMTEQCWDLLSVGNLLLAATQNGVYLITENGNHRIIAGKSYTLCHSQADKNRVWVGTDTGLVSLYVTPEEKYRFKREHKFKTIDWTIKFIVEDREGIVWMISRDNNLLRMDTRKKGTMPNPHISLLTGDQKNLKNVKIFNTSTGILLATKKGFYKPDEKTGAIIADFRFGKKFADGSVGIWYIAEDETGNIWFHSNRRNYKAVPKPDGTFLIHKNPLSRIPLVRVNDIYPDPSGDTVLFASDDGIVRFDKRFEKKYRKTFRTLNRLVLANNNPVFEGYKPNADNTPHPATDIEYADRNIKIEFASPFFEGGAMTRYRTFLEGYDEKWSKPETITSKFYKSLDAGSYTFRVKAVNVYGFEGQEDTFHFNILLPWYKTWWASAIYVLLFSLITVFAVKWRRSALLEREKKRLEHIVHQRTKEIENKNRQLEQQTRQLKEQSEKLTEMDKVKTRFFANISHEFRTPLTLIMGPLEEMLNQPGTEPGDDTRKRKLNLMLRNSRRLLNLINQLLELSKIESGKMVLETSIHNIVPFVKGIAASFETVTNRNELDLEFVARRETILACFDAQKMEDVLFNILSNAVKFTPPGGKITVTIEKHLPVPEEFPTGSVSLSVRDTGPGIHRDQLEQIFDRFYQADSTYEHHRKGSGIGLSISKELIELHNGKIDVHSMENKGTEFIIRLPLPAEETASPIQNGYKTTVSAIPEKILVTGCIDPADAEDRAGEPKAVILNDEDKNEENKNIILVVEDSNDARAYIRDSLESTYTVIEAGDGEEGVRMALEFIPDLIVSDIMMPKKDGYQLCRELKNHVNTSHIPVILLTAKAGEEDLLEGLETGADDYITKPFNTRILCARIKNLIQLRNHLQQALDRDMTNHPDKIPVSPVDKEFIKRLKEVFKKNITDPEFNIERLCEEMDMSQPTLYRKIHALSGTSPTEFIRSYRLKRAARLLEEKFGSILEIALETGFSSAAYFTKCFKKKYNCPPSEYVARTPS